MLTALSLGALLLSGCIYAAGMTDRAKVVTLVAVAIFALALPSAVLVPLGATTAAGLFGLGGLGVVLASALGGWRLAMITGALLGVLGGGGVAAAGQQLPGVLVMVSAAIGVGLSAHFSVQQGTINSAITVAFIVAEAPRQAPVEGGVAFGVALGAYAVAVALLIRLLGLAREAPPVTPGPSWTRTWGFTISLVIATIATTALALASNLGHTGGWLIMTPFIVMLPYVQDSWRKALSRGAGTVGGFALAMLASSLVGPGLALSVVGVFFAALTAYALVKKWPYATYALVLTPAIVIIESSGRSVEQTAQQRLVATLLGIAIALAVMAVAFPLDRFFARRAGVTHY